MKITTRQEFEEQVLHSSTPVLAEFRTAECCASPAQAAALAQLEQTGAVRVCTVDVAEQPMLPGRFGIQTAPAMLLFRSGRVTAAAVGARSFDDLIAMLRPVSKRPAR